MSRGFFWECIVIIYRRNSLSRDYDQIYIWPSPRIDLAIRDRPKTIEAFGSLAAKFAAQSTAFAVLIPSRFRSSVNFIDVKKERVYGRKGDYTSVRRVAGQLEPSDLDRLVIERTRARWRRLMPHWRNSTIHRQENRMAGSVAWRAARVCDQTLIFHADVAKSLPVARQTGRLLIEGSPDAEPSRSWASSMAAKARFRRRSISVRRR